MRARNAVLCVLLSGALLVPVAAGSASATEPADSPGSSVSTDDPAVPDDLVTDDTTVSPSPSPSPSPSTPPEHGGEGQDVIPPSPSPVGDGDDTSVTDPGDLETIPVLPAPDPEIARLAQLAAERVQALKQSVAVLDEQAQEAILEANSAQAAAQRAADLAAQSAALAGRAQRNVEVTAAGMYMSGGGGDMREWVIAVTSAGSIDELYRNVEYVEAVAKQRVHVAQEARSTQEQSAVAAQSAIAAQATAEAAAAKVKDTKARMVERLRAAQDALRVANEKAALGGFVSAQTVVGPDGCPTAVPSGTLRGAAAGSDVAEICRRSVRQAATPQAALAIQYAFRTLGAPYACEGVGRNDPFRFDCSSLVSRAYAEGAGLGTAGTTWAPSTRDMIPWGGASLSEWYVPVAEKAGRPGDLVVYHTPSPDSEHVVMLLADGLMLHTNSCGDVAHVTSYTGGSDVPGSGFLGIRRVNPKP